MGIRGVQQQAEIKWGIVMMYYVEIYLILGLASFIITLITEYKELVLMPWLKRVSLFFYCLTIWPYLWVSEYMLTLEDERKAKTEKLKEK